MSGASSQSGSLNLVVATVTILGGAIVIYTFATGAPQNVAANKPLPVNVQPPKEPLPVVPQGNLHIALSPVKPIPMQISAVHVLCKGAPVDHSTFAFTLFNPSGESAKITRVEFNPKINNLAPAYPDRPITCKWDEGGKLLQPVFDYDPNTVIVGQPLTQEIKGFTVPAGEDRKLTVAFKFLNVPPTYGNRLNAFGTLTIFHSGGEVAFPLEIAGPDKRTWLRLIDPPIFK